MNTIFGLELSHRFYREVVLPILNDHFPGLPHAAALLGNGSEVLGFDDGLSTDHDWGPRLQLFLSPADHQTFGRQLHTTLADALPPIFEGYSTHFGPPDPNDNGTRQLEAHAAGPISHRIEVVTIPQFVKRQLGFDLGPTLDQWPAATDWLTFPEQKLLSLTAGAVFHDQVGLAEMRARFAYFPHDVWLYLLAAGWGRVGEEEHLMGRAGSVGDEIGSALIGARLVRDIMRLSFLMSRTYGPYPKWFGTAFKQLDCATELSPHLTAALQAPDWQTREAALVPAYRYLARWHNRLGLTKLMPEETAPFFTRPFQVVALHGFSDVLLAKIVDPALKRLAQRPLIGSVDQFSDSTTLLSYSEWRPVLSQLYVWVGEESDQ